MSENFSRGKYVQSKLFFLTEKIVMQHSGLNGGLQLYLLHLLIYQTLKLISPTKTESCSCLYFLYILLNNHISTPECPLLHIRAYHCQSFRISLQHVVHNMSCYTKPLFRSQKQSYSVIILCQTTILVEFISITFNSIYILKHY